MRKLGNISVLAVFTAEITSRSRDGIRSAAWQEMEKRFFLDRIDVSCDHLIVHEAIQDAVTVLANAANAALSWRDDATMAAQATLHMLMLPWFLKQCLLHSVNSRSIF